MPCPHFKVTICQRSKGQSSVAGAAYQSGSCLFSEYDQKTKNYRNKHEVVHAEIMLPANAPPEFSDRNTLWNSVEAVENQWNSQLARRIILALPIEVPEDQYPEMMRKFCQEHFVSQGMCVDFAIHNKHDGNPHAHIMLTMRSLDENGKWLPKSRKEYVLDENGERIREPSGYWKSRKVYINDWNNKGNCEIWRRAWETIQNEFLERNNRPERISLKSYKRQGIDKVPTVHMGPAVSHMEEKGIQTNIGNLNRDIKAANSLMQSIRNLLRGLKSWLAELRETRQSIINELEKLKEPTLAELLLDYYQIRSDERIGWSSRAKLKGTVSDYQKISQSVDFLREHGLVSLDDLHSYVEVIENQSRTLSRTVKSDQKRMSDIAAIRNAHRTLKELKPIHDKYMKKNFKLTKDRYRSQYSAELDQYSRAYKLLMKVNGSTKVDLPSLNAEYHELEETVSWRSGQLEEVRAELSQLKAIRYYVSRAVPEEKAPEKVSVKDRLAAGRIRADKENTDRKDPQRNRKQNMEL